MMDDKEKLLRDLQDPQTKMAIVGVITKKDGNKTLTKHFGHVDMDRETFRRVWPQLLPKILKLNEEAKKNG